jgi:hypothetical protein
MNTFDRREHGCADRAHAEAGQLGRWLASGEFLPVEIPRLVAILPGLGGFYRRHIQMEETEMFPHVEPSFAPDDLKSIVGEMRE